MSILGVGAGAVGGTGFYTQTIDQSLRFEDGDSPYLLRTPSGTGNRKTWTISCWVKIGNTGLTSNIISVFQSASPNQQVVIRFYQDKLYLYDFGGAYLISTNRVFRDTTNFFHMLWRFDSTQSTASERIKLYINGTQETDLNDNTYPSLNHDSLWNHTNKHLIGARTDNSTPTPIQEFDGYLAEFNLVDGQALGAESFGESKNGVWIPKLYSGSYGTNGFRLTFADSSNLGDDTSGNGNDFTSSGLASTDVVLDSPTQNFATALGDGLAEPSDYQGYNNPISSEGNLKITAQTGWTNGSSNFGMTSGKWYAEVIVNSWYASNYVRIGLRARPARTYDEYFVLGNGTGQLDATSRNGRLPSFTTGDVIQLALDLENNAFYFGKNGTWGNSATTTEIANGTTTNAFASGSEVPTGDGHAYFFYAQPHPPSTTITWNFGADSSFAGAKTAQGNSDSGTSNTDFYYTPPDGFLACNTTNIPELTISPAQNTQAGDHMNVITYTGDDANSRSLTGVGFQPDLIWYKHRTIAYGHVIYDSSRGTGEAHQRSDASIADGAYNDLYGTLTSFDADGITIARGDSSGVESAFFNTNGQEMVGWNWKCGGTTPTKTYKVVVVSDSGNKYRFRNSSDSATFPQSGLTLNLQEGGTYTFDWSDSTAQGHPFRFSTTSDGTHGGGSEYTTGVVKDDSAYTTTITVASSAPPLYFYCSIHSGMGGSVNTNSTFGSTNFDGSLKSIVQTNETAGFSIVKYTGNGTDPSGGTITLGHGLTSTPQIIFHKNRDTATAGHNYWTVWTPFHAGTNMSFLSFTSNNTGGWVDTPMSSTVFSPPISNYGNVNNEDYICYLWHSVEGYSKIGTYEMNYNSDGTYVFCGFRPRFLVTKPIDQAGSWSVYDSARDPFNDGDANMSQWENATTEASFANSAVDFLSNGFKLRQSSDGYSNIASNTAIFMAFAEQPFKFSNAK